jgi:hypothetical protein
VSDAVMRLYGDEALWNELSANGMENIRRHFSFDPARRAQGSVLDRLPTDEAGAHRATRSEATPPKCGSTEPRMSPTASCRAGLGFSLRPEDRIVILSKYFVFIHFPKTGGSFVRWVMRERAPAEWGVEVIQDHPTVVEIPPAYRDLPRFGFVRNPWDWYVSWYHYLRDRGDNAFFNEVSQNGVRGFKDTILAVLDTDFVRASGLGGYSWYVHHTFGEGYGGVRLGRFETLRTDLLRILEEVATPPLLLRTGILELPGINVGKRGPYQKYYDEEMREIVARKDGPLIEAFGYRF